MCASTVMLMCRDAFMGVCRCVYVCLSVYECKVAFMDDTRALNSIDEDQRPLLIRFIIWYQVDVYPYLDSDII